MKDRIVWRGKVRGTRGEDFDIIKEIEVDLLRCDVCSLEKPVDLFVKFGQVKERRRCRECRVEARSHGGARKTMIAELKNKPCCDCRQVFHPCVMEFDHRDPSGKLFSLSDGYKYSESAILAEAEKCDVVCCNCHRLRTWKRTQE